MTDTIDLLDSIGRDASLRHASAEYLTSMLEGAHASAALTAAAVQGDRLPLLAEFGQKLNEVPQTTQSPAHEEEEESEEDQEPEER